MQQVHINRLGVNSIEFESNIVDIPLSPGGEHSFEIVIINYGSPTHVHLSASDELQDNLTFLEDNPYVSHEEYIPVIARIPFDGRLLNKGMIFVTVGYGSKTESFTINIGMSDTNNVPALIDIDERLSSPAPVMATNKKTKSGSHLSDIFSGISESFIQMFDARNLVLFSALIIILALIYIAVRLVSGNNMEIGFEVGFYTALAFTIVFTSLIAYLLTRLPIFKNK
ncbi:hypothetical protein J7W08_07680 [Methanococcoides orientis]|uniref:DUF7524 family protein n=1 Tax=Methanococcoides orientis TaxID=2822137 RepID=UPI001E2F7459|nr:hypothetical protein [Methanococcoides orientis]UGV39994.1 hypothetical protein J7W08_07680 [Methanococcoides orientis]